MSTTDATPSLESGSWRLDPADAHVGFVTRTFWGLMPVKGSFSEYEGSFDLSASPAIRLVIAAASLDTDNTKRDEHLRSGDFFGVQANPEIRFESSDVHAHGDHLHVSGTLSAGGGTVALEPTAHVHPVEGGYEIDAVARVSHRELGMTANPAGMIGAKTWLSVRGKLIPAT